MAYILVTCDRQDVDCRELTGSVVIGRAPDCDLSVRDILLSRKHCRLDATEHGWLLADLTSKNGTFVNGERMIAPRLLKEKDAVRMGRSRVVFHEGRPTEEDKVAPPTSRPVDPHEALAGTISGFTLLNPGEGDAPMQFPSPQPRPRDPAAYEREELHVMLTAIASSSWDSIYSEARQAKNGAAAAASVGIATKSPVSVSVGDPSRPRRMRPRSPIDLSLQANLPVMVELPPQTEPLPAFNPPVAAPPPAPAPVRPPARALGLAPANWTSRIDRRVALRYAAAIVWLAAGIILMSRSAALRTAKNAAASTAVIPLPASVVTLPHTAPAADVAAPPRWNAIDLTDTPSWQAAGWTALSAAPAILF